MFHKNDVVKSKITGNHYVVLKDARPGHSLSCRQLIGKHPGNYQHVTKVFAELIGRNFQLIKDHL